MFNKKSFIIITLLVTLFCLNIKSVAADECGHCDINNCGECGCELDSSGTVCIKEYSNYDDSPASCGGGYVDNIPALLPKVTSTAYTIIQVAVPVVLVIMGMLDLVKCISSQKEDEIKKGQQLLIKRLISAALVFFVFVIVKLLISFVADGTENKIMKCAECFLQNDCDNEEDLRILDSVESMLKSYEDYPDYVEQFRQALIRLLGKESDSNMEDESILNQIEQRLDSGDEKFRKELIDFLYYS